ncbi:MAG: hypothetical protein WA446_13345, partial [Steroidobacteraceae bacterium]
WRIPKFSRYQRQERRLFLRCAALGEPAQRRRSLLEFSPPSVAYTQHSSQTTPMHQETVFMPDHLRDTRSLVELCAQYGISRKPAHGRDRP